MSIISVTLLLFIIIDPLGNLPIFNHALTGVPKTRRARIILRESLFALGVLTLFLFAGRIILSWLGLEQETLAIGGGVILFLIALKMVFPEHGIGSHPPDADEEPFLVPLGVPLIAGPSAIAYLLLVSSKFPDRLMELALALFLAWFVSTGILLASSRIEDWLGHRTLRAIEKLAGMLLILIAVQMFLNGIRGG